MPKPSRDDIRSQRRFLRRQKVQEKKYLNRFYKYLNAVNYAVAKDIDENGLPIDISKHLRYERVESIYKGLYMDITMQEADLQWSETEPSESGTKDLIDDLIGIFAPESKPISLWRRLLNEFLTVRIAGRITEVNDTTRRRIAYLIEKGIEQGWGASRTATEIRKDRGYNRNRALAIARTETVTAGNQGKYLAALSSPFVMLKKWLPTIDERSRESHRDFYDREWVEMEQLFFVANDKGVLEEARFPCDVTLSASNVVNCRCIAIFKVKTKNGRPIRKSNNYG